MIKPFRIAFWGWLGEMDKLLVLRGLAAISVVIYHCQNYLHSHLHNNVTLFGFDVTWLFVPDGKMPVVIFFTLSGYLMFKAFISKRYHLTAHSILSFYKSRAKRILPLYYFIAFFFIILVAPKLIYDPQYHHVLRDLAIFNYSGDPAFVVPFWSLSVEVQFYLLVPVFMFISLKWLPYRFLKALALLLVVVIANVLRFYTHEGVQPATLNLLTNIDAFIIGGAAAYVVPYIQSKKPSTKTKSFLLPISVILGLCLLPLSALYVYKFSSFGYHTFGVSIVALLTSLFILCAELSTTKAFSKHHHTLRDLAQRPWLIFEFFGAISYGLYLWHGPIVGQTFVVPVANPSSIAESLLRAAVAVSISSVFAYLTYKYVELYKSPNRNTVAETTTQ